MEPWRTALVVTGSLAGAGLVLWPLGIWWEVRKCEKPLFTVIRPLGAQRSLFSGKSPAELRQYAPMLIAEVAVSGTMKQAGSAGFRAIAGFIFGGNTPAGGAASSSSSSSSSGKKGESIAMTSPVRMEIQSGSASSSSSSGKKGESIAMTVPVRMAMAGSEALGGSEEGPVRMSFVMPSKFSRDTLPTPNNKDVVIKEVPGHMAAALQFRGHVRSREIVEAKKQELLALLALEGLVPVGDVSLYQYHPPFTWGWQRVNEVLFEVKEAAS